MSSGSRRFWTDVASGRTHTYGELLHDIGEMETFRDSPNPSPYDAWVVLLGSIIRGTSLTMMDTHPTVRLTTTSPAPVAPAPSSPEKLLDAILHASPEWRLELFTSGTTGKPKSVRHSIGTLTRGVQAGPAFEGARSEERRVGKE